MALEILDTPSAQIIKAAQVEVMVTDDTGRVITLKKPSLLIQSRIMRVIGDEKSGYIAMVTLLLYVSAIDDDAVFTPSSIGEIEALFQRLDIGNAYTHVAEGVNANFNTSATKDSEEIKK